MRAHTGPLCSLCDIILFSCPFLCPCAPDPVRRSSTSRKGPSRGSAARKNWTLLDQMDADGFGYMAPDDDEWPLIKAARRGGEWLKRATGEDDEAKSAGGWDRPPQGRGAGSQRAALAHVYQALQAVAAAVTVGAISQNRGVASEGGQLKVILRKGLEGWGGRGAGMGCRSFLARLCSGTKRGTRKTLGPEASRELDWG